MKVINFCAGGLMGDFIHSLSACKNICKSENAIANLYITDGYLADPFRYGVQKAFDDIQDLICYQDYIGYFSIMPDGFDEPMINLNQWRKEVHQTYRKLGGYNKCWTELLAGTFNYTPSTYSWLSAPAIDFNTNGRVVIHRSMSRHNSILYDPFIESLNERPVFLTTNVEEYNNFKYKDISDPYVVPTITTMAVAIKSSKLFIGNQSSPFALASALDVNRVCELDAGDASPFYIGEEKYSTKLKLLSNSI